MKNKKSQNTVEFECLVVVGKGKLLDIMYFEDIAGEYCPHCDLNTKEGKNEHSNDCLVVQAREKLVKVGKPLLEYEVKVTIIQQYDINLPIRKTLITRNITEVDEERMLNNLKKEVRETFSYLLGIEENYEIISVKAKSLKDK